MKKYMENIIPVAVIMVLVIFFAFLAGQKVYGQTVERIERQQRDAMESTYIAEVRTVLGENGFSNSGINMTKISDDKGGWEYTVTIYHHGFGWMDESDRCVLEKELESLGREELGKISLALLTR